MPNNESDKPILYRVRDKDYKDGKPVIIWGENLSFESAEMLRDKVASEGKSYTVRVEAMAVTMPSLVTAASPPDPDPELELIRAKALAAAHGATVAAQARADALAGRPAAPIDLKMPNVEGDSVPEIDLGDDAGEMPDDISAAQQDADADIAEYDVNGKMLYEDWLATKPADGHYNRGIPSGTWPTWDSLAIGDQAAIRFEAAEGRGGKIDAIQAAHNDAVNTAQIAAPCERCGVLAGVACKTSEVMVTPKMGDAPRAVAIPNRCAIRNRSVHVPIPPTLQRLHSILVDRSSASPESVNAT